MVSGIRLGVKYLVMINMMTKMSCSVYECAESECVDVNKVVVKTNEVEMKM